MPTPRRLVVAADAELRLAAARSWLRALRAGDSGAQAGAILLVAPSRGAADEFLRGVLDQGAPAGLFTVHRPTLLQLAAELATRELARRGRHPVRGLALEALAARAVAGCRQDGELAYFAPVADLPGMPRATLRTLRELREHGVTPEHLEQADRPPTRDLARLLAAYERALDDAGLIDPPGVLRAARDVATEGPVRHPLLGLPTLLLDATPRSPVEQDLLAALVRHSTDAFATVVEGDVESLERLADVFGAPEVLAPDEVTQGPAGLGRLRRRIFRDDEPDTGQEESDDGFTFFAAAGEGREAVEVVRRLLFLARGNGDAEPVPFDRIAIALRDPATYLPLFEEALSRAGVDAYFSRGTVRPDPAGRAFLSLLACAEERLSASRFAEYLSLGQSPDPDADGAPPKLEVPWVEPEGEQLVFKTLFPLESSGADAEEDAEEEPSPAPLQTPRHWERMLVDAAVIEGEDRWRRRLAGVAAELNLQLRHLDDHDEVVRRRLEQELVRLEALRRFALPLVEELSALPETAVWGTWRRALEALATRALRAPQRVLTVLAELRPMDDVGPVSLDEVRRALEARLLDLRTDPVHRRYGRVWVGTVDELRGLSFDAVFLPGLAEGRFPRRPMEDPLLLDAHRLALDAGLPTKDTTVERERLLLRLAVGAARRRLVTTYPSLDALAGRPRVPSFYALDLLRAVHGRLPDLASLERRAVAASSSRLGWPAPRAAQDAVDDAEYDLATLLDLMDRPAGEVEGHGRFLLQVNGPLRRSLRHRYCRWNLKKLTPADGLVAQDDDDPVLPILAERTLDRAVYSPTALQNYAHCPLRFHYHAVVRLRPRDRPERLEQLDPLTRGSLFHEAQFELLQRLRGDDRLDLFGPADREREADAIEQLSDAVDQALDTVARRYEDDLAPAVPRIWQTEIEGLRIDLRGWLRAALDEARRAAQRGEESFRPERFELAFGLPLRRGSGDASHDPDSREEPATLADGWRLRGSIDLVERQAERGLLRVTDHKTGRVPDAVRSRRGSPRVGGGEILQPLLYAAVAADLLATPVAAGRLFYCTRRGDYQRVDVRLDDESRDSLDVVLTTIDRAIARGVLPAAPKERACAYCDYRPICGPGEERRTARKSDDLLQPLRNVRSLP